MLNKNDIVRIKPEWCDGKEELEMDYRVVNDEEKGRIDIQPVICSMTIIPTQVVTVEMVNAQ